MVTPAMLHLVLELRARPRQVVLVYSSFHLFILLFFTNHLEDSILSPHPSRKSSHLYSFKVAEDCLTSLIPSEAATPEYLLPLDNSVVDEKTSIGNQDRRRKAIGMSLEVRISLFEDMREKAKNARDYLDSIQIATMDGREVLVITLISITFLYFGQTSLLVLQLRNVMEACRMKTRPAGKC